MTVDGWLYGMLAQGLVVAAGLRAAALVVSRGRVALPAWLLLAVVVAFALRLPAIGRVGEILRGVWGDPAAVTAGLLFLWIAAPAALPGRPSGRQGRMLLLALALLLYLPVFGVPGTETGLHRLGWRPGWLLVGVAALGTMLWLRGEGRWTMLLAFGLAAYALRIQESDNLWEYLVDPGLLIGLLAAGSTRPSRPAAA